MKQTGETEFEYGRRTGGTVLENKTTAGFSETAGQRHALGSPGGGAGGLGVLGLPLLLLAIPFFAVVIFAGVVSIATCLLIMVAANTAVRDAKVGVGRAYWSSLWGLTAATVISLSVVLACIYIGRNLETSPALPGRFNALVDWAHTAFGAAAGLIVVIGTTAKDIDIEPGSLARLVAATPPQATATFTTLVALPLLAHTFVVRAVLRPIGWLTAIAISTLNVLAAWLIVPWLFVKFAPPQWTAFL